jgi:hypothetical protein
MRREGHRAKILGPALPDESPEELRRLAEEDRLRAEEDRAPLRQARQTGRVRATRATSENM